MGGRKAEGRAPAGRVWRVASGTGCGEGEGAIDRDGIGVRVMAGVRASLPRQEGEGEVSVI
jgi:hypothetical protein